MEMANKKKELDRLRGVNAQALDLYEQRGKDIELRQAELVHL
jgi:hypothetical protein